MSLTGILAKIEARKEEERLLLRRAIAGEDVDAPFLPHAGIVERARKTLETGALPMGRSLRAALRKDHLAVIAEVKRQSPSAGRFADWEDPAPLAGAYASGGADAMSVLTDVDFFAGHVDFLAPCRRAFSGPVLRKDFINSAEELAIARVSGADAVLLIYSVVQKRLSWLLIECQRMGLEALVEVHGEYELDLAVEAGARVIGVNNRDLRTFTVDLATTERIAKRCPPLTTLVSESGIKTPEDARRMREAGADAILVGESLARAGGGGINALQIPGERGLRGAEIR
jgi:indole-3-glycerol phosphate synthase